MTARKTNRRVILSEEDRETARILGTYLLCDSNAAEAARQLGIDRRTVRRHVDRAPRRGLDGTAPAAMPPGRDIERMTEEMVFNPKTGDWLPTRTWVKSRQIRPDDLSEVEFAEIAADAVKAAAVLATDITPPAAVDEDLAVVFPWADLHLGRKSWGLQTGEDWDLSIAADAYRAAALATLAQAPNAAEGVLLGLGDLTEADDDTDATPRSGHKQDIDTRHEKTTQVALELILWMVGQMRRKFSRVRVVILPGNHDERTARMIRVFLRLLYEDDPQVAVEDLPSVFWFWSWGRCYLGAHHGHEIRKPEDFVGKMATERADLWDCPFRYGHMGHLHHWWEKEHWGTLVQGHRSPAAKNRHDTGQPYDSGRSLRAITYHKTRGESGRVTVNLFREVQE